MRSNPSWINQSPEPAPNPDISDTRTFSASFFAMSNYALARAIRHRAIEWGPLGVRINVIVPGMTQTPMVDALENDPACVIAQSCPACQYRWEATPLHPRLCLAHTDRESTWHRQILALSVLQLWARTWF